MKSDSIPILCFLIVLLCASCDQSSPISIRIDTSSMEATVFAPGVISTGLYERDLAISKAGDQIFYTIGDAKQNRRAIVSLMKQGEHWSQPEILEFSGQYHDIEPFLSPDGNQLYFASTRPLPTDTIEGDYNLWYCERIIDKWSDPIALPLHINTEGDEFYPSVSANGNLYFTATRPEGPGREDIYISKYSGGRFLKPTPLDTTINTGFYEFNAYISPDEMMLVFSSFGRKGDPGGGDLYYSTKDENDNWKQGKLMSEKVNSSKLDYCPFIDWENRNFYFSSERYLKQSQDIETIEDFKKASNTSQNGLGDIYRISLDALDMN